MQGFPNITFPRREWVPAWPSRKRIQVTLVSLPVSESTQWMCTYKMDGSWPAITSTVRSAFEAAAPSWTGGIRVQVT